MTRSITVLIVVMLGVAFLNCQSECHSAERHCAECHSAECHSAECRGALKTTTSDLNYDTFLPSNCSKLACSHTLP
jgi:hypothetical protein